MNSSKLISDKEKRIKVKAVSILFETPLTTFVTTVSYLALRNDSNKVLMLRQKRINRWDYF